MVNNLKNAEDTTKVSNTIQGADEKEDQFKDCNSKVENAIEQSFNKVESWEENDYNTVAPNEQANFSGNEEEINQNDLEDLNNEEDEEDDSDSEEDDDNSDAETRDPKYVSNSNFTSANTDLNYVNEYNKEYDFEHIPEFVDAQTLIDRYFKEQSKPNEVMIEK